MLYLATSRSNLAERGHVESRSEGVSIINRASEEQQEAGNKHKITGSLPVISSSLLLIDEIEYGSRHEG